jgi:RNA polymerase sigma-70 factor (ECF subfamily)
MDARALSPGEIGMRRLLAQAAGGCQVAFAELYRRLSRRVFAFVRHNVENPALAEEITMDTLFAVWENAGRFRGDASVSSWALGIARHKMLMGLRRNPENTHEDIEAFADLLDGEHPDGLTLLKTRRQRILLDACLRRLSPPHRECLSLLYFGAYSVAEIAALLNIPAGTVKSRLSHARAQLRAYCIEQGISRHHDADTSS